MKKVLITLLLCVVPLLVAQTPVKMTIVSWTAIIFSTGEKIVYDDTQIIATISKDYIQVGKNKYLLDKDWKRIYRSADTDQYHGKAYDSYRQEACQIWLTLSETKDKKYTDCKVAVDYDDMGIIFLGFGK